MSQSSIISVGIDVGTTSMHLSINRLWLSNVSKPGEPVRVVISSRDSIYESPVFFTPLLENGAIDADAIFLFLRQQYELARVTASDIVSGAAIITGETAKIRNAESVVSRISSLAGQFVVASAGPNYESVLAGRGSGAADYSKLTGKVVCNVDVGGGTTNIVIFKNGQVKATSALSVGGRLVSLTSDLKILKLTDSARLLFKQLNISAEPGNALSAEHVSTLSHLAADLIYDAITENSWAHPLLITEPLCIEEPIEEIWFTGGVAEIMSKLTSISSDTAYGDIGVFLARSILTKMQSANAKHLVPPNPIRATVLGASVHTLQLSGSTVWVSAGVLPLRDVPIVEPTLPTGAVLGAGLTGEVLVRAIAQSLERLDRSWDRECVAISLPGVGRADYGTIKLWGSLLTDAFKHFRAREPYIIICAHDVGSALGQTLRSDNPGLALVCLDGVGLGSGGDFIDIGAPLAGGSAVPVVLKTLVFVSSDHSSE